MAGSSELQLHAAEIKDHKLWSRQGQLPALRAGKSRNPAKFGGATDPGGLHGARGAPQKPKKRDIESLGTSVHLNEEVANRNKMSFGPREGQI